ncbi:Arylsulfatase [Actinomadura rubteroloni]|uniref:Arylsulfatase n=1 Tax=Actinomadura rubteroloni TaxID=1926885 RepID=A0A2P4UJS7_9ACTN|nr:sulfatase-like hydrolase/transferase [Actinomadura rubteroloni]POM25302.1 Arylsulfatase [Actinomadura rubteroloni]
MSGFEPSRRNVLAAGAGGALAAALAARPAAAAPARGPNILWLISEDNNPYIGAYGDPVARTPTIDRLARDGVRYENAFSAAPVCAPSRFALVTGLPAESYGPAEHMRATGELPPDTRTVPEYLRAAGYYTTNNSKTDYNSTIKPKEVWDQTSATAHWRNRPAGAPFYSVFTYMTTHESQIFTAEPGRTRPEDVRVPAYVPDVPAIREDRARYYDLMEKMDGQLAARLAELEADGLAEDTIVFYFGDNGGILPRSKRFCYDSGLRTPLIVRYPRKWAHLAPARPGSVITAPITVSLDLPPTVLELAGMRAPAAMTGTSLTARRRPAYAFGMRNRMGEQYDMVRTARDERFRYIRNYAPHRPYGQHQAYAWQQKGYQAWEQAHLDGELTPVQERFWHEKPAEELYDLHTDPDEIHNLTENPRYQGHLNRLRRALDDHLLSVNDNGFIPEGSPLEGYEASRAPDAYPLRQVLDVAGTAIRRNPHDVARLTRALADDNEVIRYWATSGLLMQKGKAAAPATYALTRILTADPSPHVRIIAAEALARLGGRTEQAVAHLAGTLDDESISIPIRLQALTALTSLGETARPALPAIQRAARSKNGNVHDAALYLSLVLTGEYTPTTPIFGGTPD